MNGSKLEITSDANINETTAQMYMFMAFQTNLKIYSGEIDGNNLFGALMLLGYPEAYHFENLWIHDLQNEGFSTSDGQRTIAVETWISNAPALKVLQWGYPGKEDQLLKTFRVDM